MKTKQLVIFIIVFIVLALIAAVVSTWAKNVSNNAPDALKDIAPGSTGTGSTGTPKAVVLDENKSLGIGSKGAEVLELQRLYNLTANTPKLDADGKFGPKTLNGVIKVMGFGTMSTTLKAFKAKLAAATSQDQNTNFLKSLFGL